MGFKDNQTNHSQPEQSSSSNQVSNNEAPPPYAVKHDESQPLISPSPNLPARGLMVIETRGPTEMICPFEGVQITTIPSHKPGLKAGFCSGLFCFVFWPLFWLPLVTVSFQDEIHTCPNCQRVIAISR